MALRNAARFLHKSRVHGSYHWTSERVLSMATVPLLGAFFVGPALPLVDLGLGVVLPLHTHLGLDVLVQDYIPARKYKTANSVVTWSLRIATGAVLYACYQFNTTDVGITQFVRNLWKE